jgi:hypothetical protein
MKSNALPSFWVAFRALDKALKFQAKKAYRLWAENPFHSSLHFKCINAEEDVWSVRISRGYRALGIMESKVVTWFWIGSHKDYERFLHKTR